MKNIERQKDGTTKTNTEINSVLKTQPAELIRNDTLFKENPDSLTVKNYEEEENRTISETQIFCILKRSVDNGFAIKMP